MTNQPSELGSRAKQAFEHFAVSLGWHFYGLRVTPNMAEVLFNHVDEYICFFNMVKGKPQPYLFACHAFGKWFVRELRGAMRETKHVWVESQNHATQTAGYVMLQYKGDQWHWTEVIP